MTDTIFALSSGAPPAAIAVMRISGPVARDTLLALAGSVPIERQATLRRLRDARGDTLDRALVLWFPGPQTATGEDLAELHLHGGRAVVAAIETALATMPGLRRATPGEFTRRAFANGRIDLAEAEGLADLLTAETELQRRHAMTMAGGAFSSQVVGWRDQVLAASAAVEAILDFGDEDDVGPLKAGFVSDLQRLAGELAAALDQPRAEPLREGFRVVLAGPPNTGKSSLFNRIIEDEAAITSPTAGTTRDVLMRPVAIAGIPFVFIDTAGIRSDASDKIEAIGIERAHAEQDRADLVLWLGPEGKGGAVATWEIESFADSTLPAKPARHHVSALSGEGIAELRDDLVETARRLLPGPGMHALNRRQHELILEARVALEDGALASDPLVIAETLRIARGCFDRLLGRATTEDMLDTLFGRFCIGK